MFHLPFLAPTQTRTAPPDDIGGVPVRISARAKRMALRVDARSGCVLLVIPQRKNWTAHHQKTATAFVEDNRAWIARHHRPRAQSEFSPGQTILFFDKPYTLHHVPGRGLARWADDTLTVHGDRAHFNRRIRDALTQRAADILTAYVAEKTRSLGLTPGPVRLRDPASRWGSCGSDGAIMLSWRLALLPGFVSDYIVAHEVAHRVHMNHSRAFWRLCLSLTLRGAEARRWLKRHGGDIMRG